MIIIDPRVGTTQRKSRSERLESMSNTLAMRVNCKVKPVLLNSGDFCFEGNGPLGKMMIGVELKLVKDFLGSMRSERLAGRQLVEMSDDYQMSFVIVQGLWKPGKSDVLMTMRGKQWEPVSLVTKDRGFHYGEMFKHIVSMSILKNVVVITSHTEDETLWQIAHLYSWFQREWDAHRSMDPIKLQTEVVFNRVSLLRKMAAELPGIGWTRSKAVERAFISVQQMVNAPVESWKSIEGIGGKTAQKVWSALREKAI